MAWNPARSVLKLSRLSRWSRPASPCSSHRSVAVIHLKRAPFLICRAGGSGGIGGKCWHTTLYSSTLWTKAIRCPRRSRSSPHITNPPRLLRVALATRSVSTPVFTRLFPRVVEGGIAVNSTLLILRLLSRAPLFAFLLQTIGLRTRHASLRRVMSTAAKTFPTSAVR